MIIIKDNKTIEIPVIFYDGETQIDIGKTQITPSITTFKLLQSTLSNKIGISPNQITIYFEDFYNKRELNYYKSNGSHCRRRPVTSKFDFNVGELEQGFFWVVLKRGRRNRRHRNVGKDIVGVDREYLEYVNRLRIISHIETEKQKFIIAINNVNYGGYDNANYLDDYYYGDVVSSCSSSEKVMFCDVCFNNDGDDTVPFHWCKNDVVTTGFRSLVGPIAPPSKNIR